MNRAREVAEALLALGFQLKRRTGKGHCIFIPPAGCKGCLTVAATGSRAEVTYTVQRARRILKESGLDLE